MILFSLIRLKFTFVFFSLLFVPNCNEIRLVLDLCAAGVHRNGLENNLRLMSLNKSLISVALLADILVNVFFVLLIKICSLGLSEVFCINKTTFI